MRLRWSGFASVLCALSGCGWIAGLDTTYIGSIGDVDGGADAVVDGGSQDDAGVDAAEAGPSCASERGPTMVRVAIDAGAYCVDSTEVTVAQYTAFVSAGPDSKSQPAACSWNTVFTSNCNGLEADRPNQPVNCVDWCDAFAYCAWAGKRLCGRIGGGANGFVDYQNPARSQWFAACSNGGSRAYAYGNTFAAGACEAHTEEPADVESFTRCEGGLPGLFDLSGNVGEWEDSCDGGTQASDLCRRRGGDIVDNEQDILCNEDYALPRNARHPSGGFRCCKD